jgi:hypothetical protein
MGLASRRASASSWPPWRRDAARLLHLRYEHDPSKQINVVAHAMQDRSIVSHGDIHVDACKYLRDLVAVGVRPHAKRTRAPEVNRKPFITRVLREDRTGRGKGHPLIDVERRNHARRHLDRMSTDYKFDRRINVRGELNGLSAPVVRIVSVEVDDADSAENKQPMLLADARRPQERPA